MGPEPIRTEVDGRRADEHVADLGEQPLGPAGHPLAEAAEHGVHPGRGHGSPDAPDRADGVTQRIDRLEARTAGGAPAVAAIGAVATREKSNMCLDPPVSVEVGALAEEEVDDQRCRTDQEGSQARDQDGPSADHRLLVVL